jgi:hypothetical protein
VSWFHKHELILVRKTYAAPVPAGQIDAYLWTPSDLVMQAYTFGQTTFVWKCKDPECDKIVVRECLGKEVAV